MYYYPYPPGAAFATGLIWGAAMGAIWSGGHYGANYGGGDININRNTNININNTNISGNRSGTQHSAGGEKWSSGKQKGQVSRSVGANPPSSRVGDSRGGGGAERRRRGRGRWRRLARRCRERAPARWTGRRRAGGGGARRPMDRGGGGASAGSMDRGGGGGGRRRLRRLRLRPQHADGQLARRLQPQRARRRPRAGAAAAVGGGGARRRRWRRAAAAEPAAMNSTHAIDHGDDDHEPPSHRLRPGCASRPWPAPAPRPAAGASAAEQRTFATPEAAVDALSTALKANDERALVEMFGEKYKKLVSTGSPADDAARRAEAATWLATFRLLDDSSPDRRVLLVGDKAWPFPIPLVREGGAWRFATERGVEEILNRRVGRNERNALYVLQAYVDAQREYASRDRDGDGVLQYAAKLGSSPGKFDGLYWPADASKNEEASPFGPLIAQSASYLAGHSKGDAYHGYHFRILTRQGTAAAGGAYNYMINGRLIAGFAMLA